MKRSMILEYSLLERLTKKTEYENIVIGTGAFARDMRKKLLLLGLKAPFLIGIANDPENDIRHYSEISGLGDPGRYRFILCCEIDEWNLICAALPIAYRFLGNAVVNHPQLIRFHTDNILHEFAGDMLIDASNGNVILCNDRPYAVYGNEDNNDSFKIHILGNCNAGGVFRVVPESFPELLQKELSAAGFSAVIYTWGQPRSPNSDNVVRFIRDLCFHKTDLLLLYDNGISNPYGTVIKNILATRAESLSPKHQFIWMLENLSNTKVSDGVSHDVDLLSISEIQHRVFTAFSRMYGFTFWNIIPPTHSIMPEEQSRMLRGFSRGFLSRQRKRKDEFVSLVDKQNIKDYSDTFIEVNDIFSMFADWGHLSGEGNRLVAERCADDILLAFSGDRKKV